MSTPRQTTGENTFRTEILDDSGNYIEEVTIQAQATSFSSRTILGDDDQHLETTYSMSGNTTIRKDISDNSGFLSLESDLRSDGASQYKETSLDVGGWQVVKQTNEDDLGSRSSVVEITGPDGSYSSRRYNSDDTGESLEEILAAGNHYFSRQLIVNDSGSVRGEREITELDQDGKGTTTLSWLQDDGTWRS